MYLFNVCTEPLNCHHPISSGHKKKNLAQWERDCNCTLCFIPLFCFQRENFLCRPHHTPQSELKWRDLSPSTGGCHGGVSSTCLNSDSSPSCIVQMHVSAVVHSTLFFWCANGLSASLRLRAQLRGDSLISHLIVLFLGCCVIMPEVEGQVRSRLYLYGPAGEANWKNRLIVSVCSVKFVTGSRGLFLIKKMTLIVTEGFFFLSFHSLRSIT